MKIIRPSFIFDSPSIPANLRAISTNEKSSFGAGGHSMLIFRRCLLVFVLAIAYTMSYFAVAKAASNYGVKPWNKQRGWKAVAVSRVYNNWQSCGHAWSYQDKATASKDVLKRCVQYYRKFSRKSKTGCHVTIVTR